MIVLVVWIAALVTAGLILGIVGFGLVGQLSRLRRAVSAAQLDIRARASDLAVQLPGHPSGGRHSAEH